MRDKAFRLREPKKNPHSCQEAQFYDSERVTDLKHEFTAVFEQDDDWWIAYCPEIPGANGQGHSKEEAHQSLAAAISLILEDRREDALRGLPDDAKRETVTLE